MNRILTGGCGLLVAVALAGCGNSDDSALPTSAPKPITPSTNPATSPNLAAPVGPPPSQATGKIVRLDPCTAVGDDLVTRAGFDPASRERSAGEIVTDLLTEIGCDFTQPGTVDGQPTIVRSLTVLSMNSTLDELRATDQHQIVNSDPIQGRPAVIYRTPATDQTGLTNVCAAAIESADGVFDVSLTLLPGAQGPAPCDQIRELADIFATALH